MATVSTRKQIRKAAKAWLLNQIPSVADRVFDNRATKIWDTEFPLLVVFTKSESAEEYVTAPRELKRTLKLYVDVMVNLLEPDADSAPGAISGDDQIDDICEAVEQRMANFGFDTNGLFKLVDDVMYSDTEIDHNPEAERPFIVARITFDVTYYSLAPAESSELDDFKHAHIENKLPGVTEDADIAKDDLTLPT